MYQYITLLFDAYMSNHLYGGLKSTKLILKIFCHIRHVDVDDEGKYKCIFGHIMKHWRHWIYCYSYIHIVLDLYLQDIIAICVHMDLPSICKCYRCCSCQISIKTIAVLLYTTSISYTNTSRLERKWNVVCCAVSLWDLHVPVTDCYTVFDAWMRMFSLCYQRAREHLWHCVSLSVSPSVLRGEQHTPQRCVNV